RLGELQRRLKEDQDRQFDLMRQASHLENEVTTCKAQLENYRHQRERFREKSDAAAGTLTSVERVLEELSEAEAALQERLNLARQALTHKRQEREHVQRLHNETTRLAIELREQRSGLVSRVEVLERLERSHEGLDTGGREVVALLEQPNPGPWRTVLGIVADFLTVRREYAPLIDLALGLRASHFIVRDPVLLRAALEQRGQPFSGRVSFYPLPTSLLASRGREPPELVSSGVTQDPPLAGRGLVSPGGRPSHPGLIALAEQLVTCDHPQLTDLPRWLLARTLIVRDLATARGIAAHTSGYRFVTLQGELLEADGTLTVGTHHAETGILSRRSELRELREQVAQLDARLAEIERDRADLVQRIAQTDAEVNDAQQQIDVLIYQNTDLRERVAQHRLKRDQAYETFELNRSEMDQAEQNIALLE